MNVAGITERKGPLARIVGTGSYLPEKVLTNFDLEEMVETTDEWIRTRTGISQRRIAREDQSASDLGAAAAQRALEKAGIAAEAVDLIIVATISPDMPFPSTACFVQNLIGAKNAFCFDVQAACSGFLFGLETARQYIENGTVKTALVIGAEKLSCITDWQDRGTCILFGDGAGAVVLQGCESGSGILDTVMGCDGALTALLNLPAGGSRNPTSTQTVEQRLHYMKMEGNEVFKHAVRCMSDAGQRVLQKCGLGVDDVSCIIPHQANRRIIEAIAKRFDVTVEDKFYVNLDRVGNMSAASVPVALDEAVTAGRIRKGDYLLFVAFGGGFTWGASVVRW